MNSCVNCGKCCDFNAYLVHVFPYDVQRWIAKGQWQIIKSLCFGISKKSPLGDPCLQQWTFKKQLDGQCCFRIGGKCGIYASRPIMCRVYPSTSDMLCRNGCKHMPISKHEYNLYKQAEHAWYKIPQESRQEMLIELLDKAKKQ